MGNWTECYHGNGQNGWGGVLRTELVTVIKIIHIVQTIFHARRKCSTQQGSFLRPDDG